MDPNDKVVISLYSIYYVLVLFEHEGIIYFSKKKVKKPRPAKPKRRGVPKHFHFFSTKILFGLPKTIILRVAFLQGLS